LFLRVNREGVLESSVLSPFAQLLPILFDLIISHIRKVGKHGFMCAFPTFRIYVYSQIFLLKCVHQTSKRGERMKDIFKLVKANITTRQAAEYYGLNVQRNGMTLCPFHNDHTLSLKVDTRFYCFGCQAKGDVIDGRQTFGLSIQAAQKIVADFGLAPNTAGCGCPVQPPVVQQRRLMLECTALTDYEQLLNHWKA
ncbi:MAG: CHC2 zinc finger domain-containing protein, partial [Christensenellales bacterium]